MIHGVAIFRVSQIRTPIETTTTTASESAAALGGFRTVTRRRSGHAAPRGKERSTARADLPQALGDVAQRVSIGRKPGLLCRTRNLAEDGMLDDRAAGRLLEGRDVRLGNAVELVLALRESTPAIAHTHAQVGIAGEQLERVSDGGYLAFADRNLDGGFVRQLSEPADVADHERPAQSQRPHDDAGGLTHCRIAEVDANLTGGEERPEPGFIDVVEPDHILARPKPEPVKDGAEVEPWRKRAHQQEQRLRHPPTQEPEGLEQLRQPLRRVQMPIAADDHPTLGELHGRDLVRRWPGRVWYPPDRLAITRVAHEPLDVAGMDDQTIRGCEH